MTAEQSKHWIENHPARQPTDIDTSPDFWAKFMHINPESKTLYVTDSHGVRLRGDMTDSYVMYPGFKLSDDNQFKKIVSDVQKIKVNLDISNVVIIFGTNDADQAARKFIFPEEINFENVYKIVTEGSSASNFNVSDPLQLFTNMDSKIYEPLSGIFKNYLSNLNFLTGIFSDANVILSAPGPRYMLGTSSHLNYNFLALLLNFQIYTWSTLSRKSVIVNSFSKEWLRGTRNLLTVHSLREQCAVNLQHVEYSRYGAVHYCGAKYKEMRIAISKALECCNDELPSSPREWTSDGVHVNFLIGNKGAHIYNGNIHSTPNTTSLPSHNDQ